MTESSTLGRLVPVRPLGLGSSRDVKSKSLDSESDGQLIRRFAAGRDERAFGRLVERHAALVAGACARMLRQREDAEDAFQAVFLVLARRAAALRRDASLAGWLHAVAVRVCKGELAANRRRERRAREAAEVARESHRPDRLEELKLVIDEELAALPARLREVLVLCDLEACTRDEAARRLSLPVGTVSSRLARGRELMRKRLARHGLPIAVGGVAFALAKCGQAAPAASPQLIQSTVHNASIFVAGSEAAKSTLGIKIHTLAEGAIHAMILHQWKTAACLVALLATTFVGGAVAPGLVKMATAGTVFYDDFEDGSVTDGEPVTWRLTAPFNNGGIEVTNGDLILRATSNNPLDATMVFLAPQHELTVTSIQAQIRATGVSNEFSVDVLARGNESNLASYFASVWMDGTLTIHRSGAPSSASAILLASTPSALTPLDADVVLQFDLIGSQLSLFAWRPGDPKPSTPQLQVSDSNFLSGKPGVILDTPPLNGTATFRYVHVADAPIPASADGDTNFDGQVNLEDLNAVRNHFGEGALGGPRVEGDAYPFDGIVDLGDLNLVRNHFGGDGAATPEPAAAALGAAGGGLLGGLVLFGRRFRRGLPWRLL